MKKQIILFLTLMYAILVSSQSLEILQPLKMIENSSVLAQYKNQFGKWNMPDRDLTFPFALIVMHLEGSASEVKTAKEMIQLDLGTQKVVVDQYRNKPNEIWFLIENTVKNIYIDCGEGCTKQLLVSGTHFRPNTTYTCAIRYTLAENAIKEKGHVKWDIHPQEILNKASICITSLSGKVVYRGTIYSDTLAFLDYSIGYPYIFSISCPFYATHTDTILLSKHIESKSITLNKYYNNIRVKSLNSTPIRFTIDEDYSHIYSSNGTDDIGPIEAGNHILHCTQELYENKDVLISLNGDCTTKVISPEMIHSTGTLKINSVPSQGDVYIDNELKGKTPFLSDQYPTGHHRVKVVVRGYVPSEQDVEIKKGQQQRLTFELNNEADVYITTHSVPSSLYICPEGQSNYKYLGEKSWSGQLGVGKYRVKTTAPNHDNQITTIEVRERDNRFVVSDPPHQVGYLSVTVHPTGANIYVDNKKVSSGKIELPTGQHTISASKKGYSSSDTRTVLITNQQTSKVEFKLLNQWLHSSDNHPKHNFEVIYGLGFQRSINQYAGISYGYIPKHFGLNISGLYGINSKEIVLTMGPTMRLTKFWCPLNLQLAFGAGGVYNLDAHNEKISWAIDTELRFAFEPSNDFAWYSFGLGVKYFNQQIVPTFNLSLIPIRIVHLLSQIREDFPAHRIELATGYSFESQHWKFGYNYSWMPSHIGLYTQMLFGLRNNYSITAGTTFRLTPDYIPLDLQIYQGVGWFREYDDKVGGETGLKLAFTNKRHSNFGWWSLNVGCEYAQDGYVGINFGVSLGILGMVSTCGLMALYL